MVSNYFWPNINKKTLLMSIWISGMWIYIHPHMVIMGIKRAFTCKGTFISKKHSCPKFWIFHTLLQIPATGLLLKQQNKIPWLFPDHFKKNFWKSPQRYSTLILKLAWKSFQALKFSNSLTFPEFWVKRWNSLTFPWFFGEISNSLTFPGSPGCVATLGHLLKKIHRLTMDYA